MELLLAEKHSVAEAIASVLAPGVKGEKGYFRCGDTVVSWLSGHLLELYKPEDYDPGLRGWTMGTLPMLPDQWRNKPIDGNSQSQINVIRGLLKQADGVIHAGDPDAEGQLLVDELLHFLGNRKPVKRLWLAAVDEVSIRRAFKNIKSNKEYQGLLRRAQGRQRADWLIGFNLSRLYTCLWRMRGGPPRMVLSVGRVQTPAMAMVVRRDLEIEQFVPHDYFTGHFLFGHAKKPFRVSWVPNPEETWMNNRALADEQKRVIRRAVLEKLLTAFNNKEALVHSVEQQRHDNGPPLPYSLSALQKEASRAFGYSPKQVLDAAQSLYLPHKLTTYPRTDSGYLVEEQHADAVAIFDTVKANLSGLESFGWPEGLEVARKSKAWNTKKATPHHGIIPTQKRLNLSELSPIERNLYLLIVKRFLAQFMPNYIYLSTKVVVMQDAQRFEAKGRALVQLGWRSLSGEMPREEDEQEDIQALPPVVEGDRGQLLEGEIQSHTTKPPPRFDGGRLIEAMEKAGLGTEATRSDIIEEIIKRGYLQERQEGRRKGTVFVSTPLGRLLVQVIPKEFTEPALTDFLEQRLKAVEKGAITLKSFEDMMRELVVAAVADGKDGIGLNGLDPALLPPDLLASVVALQEKKASAPKRKAKTPASKKKAAPA